MKSIIIHLAVALAAIPAFVHASQGVTVRENEVVPIKFDSSINAKSAHVGDRFKVTVDRFQDLPEGTQLEGIIREIQKAEGKQRAYAELEFTDALFPNGERVRIHAVPTPLGDAYVRRDRNGRLEGKKPTRRDHVVIGGTLGGLIFGSLIKKPFEGAIIGALAGILVAETDGMNTSGQLIVDRNQKMGALFDRETRLEWDSSVRNETPIQDADRNSRDLRIEFNDELLKFDRDVDPYQVRGTIFVPLSQMAEQLGLSVERSGDRTYIIENDEHSLRVEVDSDQVRADGRRITLPRPTELEKDTLYVPLDAFAAMFPDALKVNGTKFRKSSFN